MQSRAVETALQGEKSKTAFEEAEAKIEANNF